MTLRKNRRTEGFTESLQEIGYQGVHQGDLVIHAMDAFAGAIGVSDSDGKCTPVYAVCEPKHNANPQYYARVVREMARTSWITALAKGIRERSTDFRYEAFANQLLPIPPVEEQERLIAFLARTDRATHCLICAKQRLIELLNEQKQAIIHRAVTRGLDPDAPMKPTGLDWLPEVPEHWELRRLKAVSSFITSGSRGWADFYSDEGAIFLRIGNLSITSIDLKLDNLQHVTPPEGAEGKRTRVRPNDLLISITAFLGAVGIVPEAVRNAYVNQHTALVRLRKNLIEPRWAAYCLHSAVGNYQFKTLTNGGTKEGLTLGDVGGLWLLYPPLDEQDALVRYLNVATQYAEAAIQRAHREIELIREYRTRLISDVVTGKLDVRGVELPGPEEEGVGADLDGLESVATEGSPDSEEIQDAAFRYQ